VSPWLIASITAAGAVALLADPARRTRAKHLLTKYGVPAVDAVFTALEEARNQEAAGATALRQVLMPGPVEPSLKQRVASVLARQDEPLLAHEIGALVEAGFPRHVVPTVAAVRAELQAGTEFVQCGHRWEFGRRMQPMVGTV
jgi:hypothetical protein